MVGKVLDTREIEMIKRDLPGGVAKGCLGLALLLFQPILVLTYWIFGRRPPDKQTVHLLRVETASGGTSQARIEKELRGASIDAGDMIFLWGTDRDGTLVVTRAFNHTIDAEITLR